MSTSAELGEDGDVNNKDKKRGPGLGRASGTVAFFTLISRVLGMIRDMVVAAVFGAGFVTDAFFVAFRVPNLLRSLMAEGSLANAFVPVLAEEERRSTEAARQAIRAVTTFVLVVSTVLTVLGMIFAPQITTLFAPGFGEGPKTQLASSLMILMFPYVVIVSLLALASAVLNSRGSFGWPASSQAIMNLVMILGVLFVPFMPQVGIYTLAISVLIGGLIALFCQLRVLKKLGYPLGIARPFANPAVRKLLKLMLPSVFSASIYQIMIFFNTLLASLLIEGSVSWLFYADRIFQFPLGVFSLALATALLPSLSRLSARNELGEMNRQLSRALGWMLYGTIPAAIGMALLSEQIMEVLFRRGTFSTFDAQQSARALVAFSIGLWSISCQSILSRAYLARHNSRVPSAVSCVALTINMFAALLLMGKPAIAPDGSFAQSVIALQQALQNLVPAPALGHVGLALAGSIGSFCSVCLLVFFLPRVGLSLRWNILGRSFLQTAISSAALVGAILGINQLLFGSGIHFPAVVNLILQVFIGAVSYFGVSLLIGSEESQSVLQSVKTRLRR